MSKTKVSRKDFAYKAIDKLRKPYTDKATGEQVMPKGLHTVYSGFNQAWKDYYGDDPIAGVNALIKAGKLEGHPSKNGFTIYKVGEMPEATANGGKKALAVMGLL